MIVAGVMSGTSADGIDVALVRISGQSRGLRLKLLAHQHFAYPARVREAVLASMDADAARVADLARLNVLLGELYTDAVATTIRRHRTRVDLVGCHGQTLYHQGDPDPFLGRPIATTWQTGEGATIAQRLRIPVVSDFRPADMAAGGKGAPLVPVLDLALYAHSKRLRVLQNIGGIANLTIIPAGQHLGETRKVIALDTGPGNMVIDACAQNLFGKGYDRNGMFASRGKVINAVLRQTLAHPFFRRKPPKTAGREEFGRQFVSQFLSSCGHADKHDVIATATALTASSIISGLKQALTRARISIPISGSRADYVVSGGGVANRTLMRMISAHVEPFGFRVLTSDVLGMPSQAKEAAAFALLAYQTWNRRAGNVPTATGANRPAVLGKISYV
ncbi:MAG TPA: anhydro-N-acetylmuramic acid kinase [Terriglobales bacterium]|nr:anhydro-N-acetylmuramic acid kinase [Terriglobales bacterium]